MGYSIKKECRYSYRNQEIRIVILEEAYEKNIIGLIISEMFPTIGLCIMEEDNREFVYLTNTGNDEYCVLYIHEELLSDLLVGKEYAVFTIMHEVGHVINGDLRTITDGDKDALNRKHAVTSGKVSEYEISADAFAAEVVGKEMAVTAIEQLIGIIKKDSERMETEMAIKEFEMRKQLLYTL